MRGPRGVEHTEDGPARPGIGVGRAPGRVREAARAAGAGEAAIMGRHVLPNILSPIIVQATFTFSAAILAEAALSFLGVEPRRNSKLGFLVGAARWLLRRHHDLHRRVRRIGALHDYILLRLTGTWMTDYATGPGGPAWPGAAGRLAGVDPAAFPAPQPMHARAGRLRPEPAADLGLDSEIPVAVGGQDGACANFSAGAVEPGDMCITLSTNSVVRLVTGAPVPDEFGYVVAPSGSWAWVRGVMRAGRALDAVVADLDEGPVPAEPSRHRALTPRDRLEDVPHVLDLPETDIARIADRVRLIRAAGHAPNAIYAGAVDESRRRSWDSCRRRAHGTEPHAATC